MPFFAMNGFTESGGQPNIKFFTVIEQAGARGRKKGGRRAWHEFRGEARLGSVGNQELANGSTSRLIKPAAMLYNLCVCIMIFSLESKASSLRL